jgi:hypothetical protein
VIASTYFYPAVIVYEVGFRVFLGVLDCLLSLDFSPLCTIVTPCFLMLFLVKKLDRQKNKESYCAISFFW